MWLRVVTYSLSLLIILSVFGCSTNIKKDSFGTALGYNCDKIEITSADHSTTTTTLLCRDEWNHGATILPQLSVTSSSVFGDIIDSISSGVTTVTAPLVIPLVLLL